MSERSPDTLATQLQSLAPTVDMDAARRLFDRDRIEQGDRRRWLLPAAVIALLVAGVVGIWALARDNDGVVPADRVEPTDEEAESSRTPSFDVLLVVETTAPAGSIQTATNADELSTALSPLASPPTELEVDVERAVVGVFNVEGDACPLELIGFDISGVENNVWSPRFQATQEACDNIGLTWAFVVAFDRAVFGPSVTFVMPSDSPTGSSIDESEPGDEFEMIAVEATALPFGTIRVAQSADELAAWWNDDLPGIARPVVDFGRSFVASFTLPDDACPDVLVQFRGEMATDGVVWEPQFEPPPGGCEQPLITRTYVVRIARPPLASRITLRLPADAVFDYPANELTVDVAPSVATIEFGPEEDEPAATEHFLRTNLPPTGSAKSVMSIYGPIWVVRHEDGSLSALPAVVRMPPDEDTGVTGLGRLVAWDAATRTFAGRWLHDEFGRAVNGPGSDDLVGFEAGIDGDMVAIHRSDRDRIPGDPLDVPLAGDHGLLPLDLGDMLALDMLPTLSSRFAGWRLLDASLVVEQGVGTLCVVDSGVPVPDLATCDGSWVETQVTSAQPDITSWFFGPVLAETDEFGEIITVAPLGGQASRNDGPPPEVPLGDIEVVIDDVVSECNPTNTGTVIVTLLPGWTVDVLVEVAAGSTSLGSTQVSLQDGQVTDVRVEVADRTGDGQVVIVRSAVDPAVEYASAPLSGCP